MFVSVSSHWLNESVSTDLLESFSLSSHCFSILFHYRLRLFSYISLFVAIDALHVSLQVNYGVRFFWLISLSLLINHRVSVPLLIHTECVFTDSSDSVRLCFSTGLSMWVSLDSSESGSLLIHQREYLYWFIIERVSLLIHQSVSLLIHQRECLFGSSESGSLLIHQRVCLYWFIRERVSLLIHQRMCLYWLNRECVSTNSSEKKSLLVHQRMCLLVYQRVCLY